MVSTNHCDTSISKRLLQGLTITFGLDGWITFDARTQAGIVAITEIKMTHGSLSGDIREVRGER